MTHHIILQLAYDGSSYFGWQKTKEGKSVEATLTEVLSTIFSEPLLLRAASRTDRGVHAEGQVVDFFSTTLPKDLSKIGVSINQLLPPDIRCMGVWLAPYDAFHPTLSAFRKTYRYAISYGSVQLPCVRFSHWHVRYHLNKSILNTASTHFLGTHDFRGFSNWRKDLREDDTIRTVHSIHICDNPQRQELIIEITGDNFLYKMVRNIVGTLVWIAVGKIDVSAIDKVLSTRKREFGGITAPAHGLTLLKVDYEGFIFQTHLL